MTFVRNSKGKVQAQNKDKDPNSKCFDDRIFAWGLMWLCHLWLPSYRLRKEQPVNPAWAEHIERRKKRPEYTGETIMSV